MVRGSPSMCMRQQSAFASATTAAIAVVGIVGIVVGGGQDDVVAGAGVALVIAALIVWMVNWMYRLSVQSNRERETEEAARDYYDLHGHWPDE